MKCAILVNLSTTLKIESCPLWVLGKPRMKSILTESQGLVGICNDVYNLVFWLLPLACWHTLHLLTNLSTSYHILGQKYKWYNCTKVLSLPKWPVIPPFCFSYIEFSLMEHFGIHSLLFLKIKPSCSIYSIHGSLSTSTGFLQAL